MTKCTRTIGRCGFNFNPHSPRREWLRNARKSGIHTTFQSTLSSQRVTTYYKWEKLVFNNFNPHSPRREWPTADVLPDALRDFNPHSPRREWRKRISYQRRSVCISIHTLLAESDISTIFKFTCTCNFNPHSPRREWPESQIQCWLWYEISIHTLLAESDRLKFDKDQKAAKFQSTLSSQRVTRPGKPGERRIIYFNPHSPRREWPAADPFDKCKTNFNPHSPRREWPGSRLIQDQDFRISIHTLLAESDPGAVFHHFLRHYFNPHSPRREWPICLAFLHYRQYFNPHSPRREWPGGGCKYIIEREISIHTLLAESD